jgi:hypothetical protein
MPNVTRITSNGTFYTANTIDELSFNSTAGTSKNLLPSSQDFSLSPWTNRLRLVSTTDLAPDGTSTATTWTYDRIFALVQNTGVNLIPGKTYTVSIYVKVFPTSALQVGQPNTNIAINTTAAFANYNVPPATVNGIFTNFGPQTATQTAQLAPNGFTRCTLTFTVFNNQISNGIGFWLGGFNGNDMTGYTMTVWGAQLEEGTVATDYVRTNSLGFPTSNVAYRTTQIGNYYVRSYIDEVSQNRNTPNKNLLTWSQDYTQSDWSKVNGFMQTGFLAPNGTPTAQKFTESAGTVFRQFYRGVNSILYNQVYTISCYYKPAGRFRFNMGYGNQASLVTDRTVQVNLNTNTITTSDPTIIDRGIIPVNDGWYRVYATFRTPGSGFMTAGTIVGLLDSDGQFVFNGDGTSGILIWGAQLELGTLSDYVQTGSSTTPVTNFVKRDTANGVSMVTSQFDERNGVLDQVVDSSLVVNLDAAKFESYPERGTTWFDTTPNKNDMTIFNSGISNSPIVWNYNSQSFLALGNNDGTSISGIANATVNTPSFSIEIWSRVLSFRTGDFNNNMISGRGTYLQHGHRMGYNPAGASAAATTGTVGFYSVFNGGNISLTSSTISINTWYQTVITFDDTRKLASFYVNGVLVASQRDATYTLPQQPAWTQGPSVFTNGQGTASINGNIGNFMYYNRPLVASEVLQNYSAIRGRYGI